MDLYREGALVRFHKISLGLRAHRPSSARATSRCRGRYRLTRPAMRRAISRWPCHLPAGGHGRRDRAPERLRRRAAPCVVHGLPNIRSCSRDRSSATDGPIAASRCRTRTCSTLAADGTGTRIEIRRERRHGLDLRRIVHAHVSQGGYQQPLAAGEIRHAPRPRPGRTTPLFRRCTLRLLNSAP